MKRTLKSFGASLIILLFLTWSTPINHLPTALAAPDADAVVGNGTPASCNETEFDDALDTVQNSGSGTITFNCGGPASINFSAGKIILNNAAVTIDGASQITLSGVNTYRHFSVNSLATLILKNITLTNGYNNDYGGGSILNLGVLTLNNTTIKDSNVDSGFSGGAILSSGLLTITNSLIENNGGGSAGGLFIIGANAVATITGSTLSGNHTTNTQYGLGGAISNWNGADVTIHSSTLSNNQARNGGAIYNENAVITIDNGTVIEANSGTIQGGGIYNEGGLINISDTELTNNSNGGGGGGAIINSLGTIILDTTTVSNNLGNFGGGIANTQGSVTLKNSVINSNLANEGGGLSNDDGNLTLSNTTVSDNTATVFGGGISNINGSVSLNYVTISNNSSPIGGGIFLDIDQSGAVTLKNVIINRGAYGANCSPTVTSNGFNLSSDGSCGLNQSSDQNNTDPMLGPLANNGGLTWTHMLLTGSPAIDGGQCITGVTTDQRGLPRLQGNACDIGALERQPNDTDGYFIFMPSVLK